jgi:hypothetical protein
MIYGVNSAPSSGESGPLTFRRILQRLPLYFGLALAGIAAVVVLLAIQIHFGLPDISQGWIGFAVYTGLLFWIIVRRSTSLWNRWRFWAVTLGVFIAHCAVFVAALRVYPEWRMIWFVPLVIVEAGILEKLFAPLFREKRARKHPTERI